MLDSKLPRPCRDGHKLSPCIEPFDHFRVALVNHAPLEFESISQLPAIKREVVIEQRKPLDRLVLRQSRINPPDLFADEVMDPGINGKLFMRSKRAPLLAPGGLDVRKIGHDKSRDKYSPGAKEDRIQDQRARLQ